MTNLREHRNNSQNYFKNKYYVIKAKIKNNYENQNKAIIKSWKSKDKQRRISSSLLKDFRNNIERL
jgi:hypothetical protein